MVQKIDKKWYIGLGLFLIISIGFFLSTTDTLYQFVCTEWSYDLCTQQHTEYQYCPVYDDVTYTANCEKCGSRIVKPFIKNIDYNPATLTPYCPTECNTCLVPAGKEWAGGTSTNFAVPISQAVCYGVPYTECKTCTITEVVGQEKCGSVVLCDKWETLTGESIPEGAKNAQCINGFESCGNDICEPSLGETASSCVVDCGTPICTPGDIRCENDILQTCDNKGFNWLQTETCQYGCLGNSCCIPDWEQSGEVTPCINGTQSVRFIDGCGNEKYDDIQCTTGGFQDISPFLTTTNIIIGIISILTTLIAIFTVKKTRRKK